MATAETEILKVRSPKVRAFSVKVLEGFDRGKEAHCREGRMTLGTAQDATLRLTDPTVSRYHVELTATESGVALRDLGSSNGVVLGAATLRDAVLRDSAELVLGRTRVALSLGADAVERELHAGSHFGGLLGQSDAMREVFAALSRAAPTRASVLITGESGTGKEVAARAVHGASPRRDGPFEVIDCGAVPPSLIESELFGHAKGSFTGAVAARRGAFERASGGTLFLDELGELPLDMQPKLLRALAEGEVRPVGDGEVRKVDVRVVAATNRDLRREINQGRFRADLFYRLAVVHVRMPPLRERLDDLPLLVPRLLDAIGRDLGVSAAAAPDDPLWATLGRHGWPGNVRELRNFLEQWVILRDAARPLGGDEPAEAPPGADAFEALYALPLRAAHEALLERFDRAYLSRMLSACDGNASEAARRAGVDRVTLYRTLRRLDQRRDAT